ncbi:hypothetical protein HA402_008174 [Bradysia odoriphaga]|nr:hypothetical protein HA402_008174 [Bradysia odoriphaga]
MKLSIVLLAVLVLVAPKGSEANYLLDFLSAAKGLNFNITPYLSRLTCSSGSTCNGMANAYSADRGVGCSTRCGGSFTTFAVAGISGLPKCFRSTAPSGTEFIQSCYCCFGYVFDDETNSCIDPSTCTRGFGVY